MSNTPVQKTTIYKDFRNNFAPHPLSGDLLTLTNEDSIKQSLKNLILSNYYEWPFQPKKGGNIVSQLFENMNSLTESTLKYAIEECIKNFESRVDLQNVLVSADFDNNAFNVTIVFRTINNSNNTELKLILKRIR